MSDELETMQSELIQNEPVQPEAPAESAVAAESAEAPVKKRRGRPPKKRVEAEAESAPAETAAEPESIPENKPVKSAQAVFGSKSAVTLRARKSVIEGLLCFFWASNASWIALEIFVMSKSTTFPFRFCT